MQNFRMLNRRPLELPALDTDVPMVNVEYQPLSAPQVRTALRQLPNLLYNKYSGWYFFLSQKAIGKLRYETYSDHTDELQTIHLSAVTNIDTLILHAVLGYSKPESLTRLNSNQKEAEQNIDIKAIHRFYAGAWINGKPYSVRLTIREYHDGRAELGEEAKAYALHLQEMKEGVTGQFSESPASHGLTRPSVTPLSLKNAVSGISAPSPRCGQVPPTDTRLTDAKIVQGKLKSKFVCTLPNPLSSQSISYEHQFIKLQDLIESNLKEGEEPCYRQRAEFDYSKTGTDCLESIFDRLRLTPAQRTSLYKGDKILATDVRIHNEKTDVLLYLERGELVYRTVNLQTERGL
ncbi:MAG: hypothetical protein K2O01_03070 [Bacteroidales bacterium]|nr:hypothetical protein [Bacteroidales bacterium]